MRSIPCLDEGTLRLIRIVFCIDFLDSDFSAVFGEDDVLLLHLLDAALGELVGVEEDLITDPSHTSDHREENKERDEVQCAHGCGDDDVARLVLR